MTSMIPLDEARGWLMPKLERNRHLECDDYEPASSHSTGKARFRMPLFMATGLAIWTLVLLVFSKESYNDRSARSMEIYTPLQDSIEYEIRIFTQGLWGDHSVYQDAPNATNTAAWKEISKLGIIKLDDDAMSKLSQQSIRYTRDPQYWAGAVEMFHNLHCLHHLRMHVWAQEPEVFYGRDPTKDEGAAHIDHCIDHIRQSLMCQGSTDIITFRRDYKDRIVPNFDGPHVCRKYEPIAEWTRAHKAWNMTPEGDEEEHEE